MIICLLGPHAVGKTTAMYRWSMKFPDLKCVVCDNDHVFQGYGTDDYHEERIQGWTGKTDEKIALATLCAESPDLWVMDGNTARVLPWLKVVPIHAIIHTYCSPEKFEVWMKKRCERNGKKYNEKYWDRAHLVYEAENRFRNAYRKHLSHIPLYDFLIENQAKDWKYVDYQFIKLYHEIRNDHSS